MKKILFITLFILITLLILFNYLDISESIKLSFNICFNNLFPSIIPFMILSNILINYNFTSSLNDIFGSMINKLFKVNKNTTFAIILSLFTGTPSNAKYLKDLYDSNLINENDISKTLNFCHFTNPIFILSTIGYEFLNNKRLGLIILISHYISGFILGLLCKKKDSAILNIKNKQNEKNFITILNESIKNTASNLLLILGVITTSLIITTILNSIIKIPDNYKFLYGLIEVTQGLKYLSISNLNIILKTIISTFLISFGGISIHMQVFSIIDNKKIKYKPYLLYRIIHAFVSSIICLLIISRITI